MQQCFVHLRVHTEFSIVDGLVQIKPLLDVLPKKGMNAIAVTDYCNFFAAVKFFQSAISVGVKPILGCDLPCHDPEKPTHISSIVLLCQNEVGYRNLTRLVSKAYQEGQYLGEPRVHHAWISSHAEGLIALSGGRSGAIGQALLADDENTAYQLAHVFMNVFPGRFYLEIQRTGRPDESIYNERVVRMAEKLNLPLVATNDVRFLHEDDYEAHEARVCIHDGYALSDPRRNKNYTAQQYLRSADEMLALFSDLPQALQNTVEVSKRCTVKLDLGNNYLPNFPIPDGSSVEGYLSHLAQSGLDARLIQLNRRQPIEALKPIRGPYEQRLQLELSQLQTEMSALLAAAVQAGSDAMQESNEEVVISGERNLLRVGELSSNMQSLRQLFDLFEQKTGLINLLDMSTRASGVQIFIGGESQLVPMDDMSIVTSSYQVNGKVVGTLGVIGPTRMAYERVIPIVDITAKLLSNALSY